jgi:epoxyqueuosine reductase
MTHERDLKIAAQAAGADLVGIADLTPFKLEGCPLPSNVLENFTSAVSVAIHLDDTVIDGIDNAPTPDYVQLYRSANATLDMIASQIANWIKTHGFAALAISASQMVDEASLSGSVSHKAVARMAGIGWQGKSLLIISPQFGPRIRLSTVLTDMPLNADAPLKNRCGGCMACTKSCPASAIRGVGTVDRYKTRDEALWLARCASQTLRFKSRPEIGARVCGVCVRICPFGRPKRARAHTSPR